MVDVTRKDELCSWEAWSLEAAPPSFQVPVTGRSNKAHGKGGPEDELAVIQADKVFDTLHNHLTSTLTFSPSTACFESPSRRCALTMRLRQLSILAALPLAACLALASPTHYAMRADTSDEEASTSPNLEVPVVHKGKEFDMASAPPRPVVEQVDTSSVGHKSKPLDLPEVMPSSSSSAAEKLPVEEAPSQPSDWGMTEAVPVAAAPAVPPPAYKGKLIDPLDPPIAEALTHEAVPEDESLPQPLNDTWSTHVDVQDDSAAPVHKGKPFSPFDTPIWDIPYRPRPHHKKPKPHHKAANHTEGGRLKGDAQVDRREAVKRAFLFNYEAYEKYAWGSDLLKPIAKVSVGTACEMRCSLDLLLIARLPLTFRKASTIAFWQVGEAQ